MTTLSRRVLIHCPLAQAPRLLESFFQVHGDPRGESARFDVGVEATIPGIPAPISLNHGVVATLKYDPHPTDMHPRFGVEWAPTGDGPLPKFSGTLSIESDEDYDAFFAALEGQYEPPLGIAGRAFDALVGHRIAEATADQLLHRIRDYVEKAYAAEEAGKPG